MKRSKAAVLTAVLLGLGCTAGALPAGAAFADTKGDVPSGASYTIMSRLSGKYMTAGEDGNVLQWEQQAGDSQIWQIISTNREKNLCKILSADGRALTVEGGDETNGNNIALAPYEDTPAQHFILHRTDDAYYI
ncbi:MAG: RICIN domain-containing protein, partial [Oscillospiraceae bacterium]|nr:RICIN domain-containing protein [Oscillospiraceae bacterium]